LCRGGCEEDPPVLPPTRHCSLITEKSLSLSACYPGGRPLPPPHTMAAVEREEGRSYCIILAYVCCVRQAALTFLGSHSDSAALASVLPGLSSYLYSWAVANGRPYMHASVAAKLVLSSSAWCIEYSIYVIQIFSKESSFRKVSVKKLLATTPYYVLLCAKNSFTGGDIVMIMISMKCPVRLLLHCVLPPD
jgi:hypothetical protein